MEKLASLLSKVDSSDGKELIWALKLAMLAVVQQVFEAHL